MATKLTAFLFISSALLLLITAVILIVPNLISYTICASMAELQELMGKMSSLSAIQPGMGSMPATHPDIPALDAPQGSTCDYQMSVSLGIWRCKVSTTAPVPVTWEGSYITLGDDTETAFDQMLSMVDGSGIGKMLLGDNAGNAMADLIRTMFIRVEIEATIALLVGFIGLIMTFVNMSGKDDSTKPLTNILAALCHLIQAILLGVALGAFAQQLQQMSSLADIYTMLKITDEGYGMLVMGFVVVLGSTLLAVTHLLMLVSHLKKENDPNPEMNYSLLPQSQDLSDAC